MDGISDRLIEEFKNPKNVGIVRGANAIGRSVDEERSDMLRIYLKIEKNKIVEAKFKAFGSSSLIAVGSVATTILKGKNAEVLDSFDTSLVEKELGVLAPHSKYCLNMLKDALTNARDNFHK